MKQYQVIKGVSLANLKYSLSLRAGRIYPEEFFNKYSLDLIGNLTKEGYIKFVENTEFNTPPEKDELYNPVEETQVYNPVKEIKEEIIEEKIFNKKKKHKK